MPADGYAGTEAEREVAVLADLERMGQVRCADCAVPICGHQTVMSMCMGFKDAPRCLACLAAGLGRAPGELKADLLAYVERRACWRAGWRWSGEQEGFGDVRRPACLWSSGETAPAPTPAAVEAATTPADLAEDETWDAGDMSCGDLLLELRIRLKQLRPGQVIRVRATDVSAPADIPSWCNMTRHALRKAEPPSFWIARRPD